MIYVSFVELFVQALEALSEVWDGRMGHFLTVVAFFAGMLLIGIIDRLVPSVENPHEAHLVEEMKRRPHNPKLMRMGVMTALAIAIHNFPEGIATFASAVDNRTLGVAIAVAIAIHNIPEGYRRLSARFLCYGQPAAGVSIVVVVRFGRAGRGIVGLVRVDAFHDTHFDGVYSLGSRRNHGFHLYRRIVACRPRVW